MADPVIERAPFALGNLTERHLLAPAMSMILMGAQGATDGLLFRVTCDGYVMAAWLEKGELIVQRNSHRVSVAILASLGHSLSISWGPEEIQVRVTDSFGTREQSLTTPLAMVPFEALDWLQRRELTPPPKPFQTDNEVVDAVMVALGSVQPLITDLNGYEAFWEKRDGAKPVPKHEAKLTAILHAYFNNVAFMQGLKVSPEHQVGPGRIDYLFTGALQSGRIVEVCCEVKLLHSEKLADGIETQLPEYKRLKRTPHGVYVVIDCGPEYPPIASFTKAPPFAGADKRKAIELQLAGTAARQQVRLITLNIAKPNSPSAR